LEETRVLDYLKKKLKECINLIFMKLLSKRTIFWKINGNQVLYFFLEIKRVYKFYFLDLYASRINLPFWFDYFNSQKDFIITLSSFYLY